MDEQEIEKRMVVHLVHERGDIIQVEDGFYNFWPVKNRGYFTAHNLRCIADELDRLNAPIQADLEKYFESTNLDTNS